MRAGEQRPSDHMTGLAGLLQAYAREEEMGGARRGWSGEAKPLL
jgi:hypothetical protein